MTISVCMGTYNGENYIEQQLKSLLNQTREPDEVIICDDSSDDKTAEIIRRFIDVNHLQDSWKLYCNNENKGYPLNFYYAMGLCTMDIVFLADQDDVWDKNKIERMCNVFEKKPEASLICCKFGLIDADGNKIRTVMLPSHSRDTGKLRQIFLKDVFYKCEWPGMVMAYRNEWYLQWNSVLKQEKAKCETGKIPHDFLICVKAADEEKFWQIDEKLAYHRRHGNNAGREEHRVGRLLSKSRKLAEIEIYIQMLQNVKQGQVLLTETGRQKLEEKYRSMWDRYKALKSGKVRKVLFNAWKHITDMRIATVICDLMIIKQKDLWTGETGNGDLNKA